MKCVQKLHRFHRTSGATEGYRITSSLMLDSRSRDHVMCSSLCCCVLISTQTQVITAPFTSTMVNAKNKSTESLPQRPSYHRVLVSKSWHKATTFPSGVHGWSRNDENIEWFSLVGVRAWVSFSASAFHQHLCNGWNFKSKIWCSYLPITATSLCQI